MYMVLLLLSFIFLGTPDNIRVNPRGTYWIAAQGQLKDTLIFEGSPVIRQVLGAILSDELFMKIP